MPEPLDNESRQEFVERCIPMVINEGTAQNGPQAYAVCISMYDKNEKIKQLKTQKNVNDRSSN